MALWLPLLLPCSHVHLSSSLTACRTSVRLASPRACVANQDELAAQMIDWKTEEKKQELEDALKITEDEAAMIAMELAWVAADESEMAAEWQAHTKAMAMGKPAFASPPGGFALDVNGARTLLAVVAAVYGTNYASVKLLDEWVGVSSMAALLRFSLALVVVVPALLLTARREPRVLDTRVAADGLQVGLLFALGYVVQAVALETSQAGVQAFLLSLTVVVCPALQTCLDGVKQPARVWAASVLAALGVGLLESGHLGGGGAVSQGDVLGLLQPIFFGAGFHRLEHAMHDAETRGPANGPAEASGSAAVGGLADDAGAVAASSGPMDPSAAALAMTAYSMAATLAVAIGWSFCDVGGDVTRFWEHTCGALGCASVRPEVAFAVFWCGIVTTAGCGYAEANVLAKLSASDAMVIFATEPLWAAGFAWLALGELMGTSAYAGGSLIVLACVLSSGVLDGAIQGVARKLQLAPVESGMAADGGSAACDAPALLE